MQTHGERLIARCAIATIICGLMVTSVSPAAAQGAGGPPAPVDSTAPKQQPGTLAFTREELKEMVQEAATQAAGRAAKQAAEPAATAATKRTVSELGKRDFLGISFGVGIAATLIHRGSEARIEETVMIGEPAVVRVTKRTRVPTRLLLESHYFFSLNEDDDKGLGPFLVVQPGVGEIIEAVGFGLMVGFRRGDSTQSFNLGLGGLVDASSPVLGDGIAENAPLPAGEMTVRLRHKSVFSWLALFSFSF